MFKKLALFVLLGTIALAMLVMAYFCFKSAPGATIVFSLAATVFYFEGLARFNPKLSLMDKIAAREIPWVSIPAILVCAAGVLVFISGINNPEQMTKTVVGSLAIFFIAAWVYFLGNIKIDKGNGPRFLG